MSNQGGVMFRLCVFLLSSILLSIQPAFSGTSKPLPNPQLVTSGDLQSAAEVFDHMWFSEAFDNTNNLVSDRADLGSVIVDQIQRFVERRDDFSSIPRDGRGL